MFYRQITLARVEVRLAEYKESRQKRRNNDSEAKPVAMEQEDRGGR